MIPQNDPAWAESTGVEPATWGPSKAHVTTNAKNNTMKVSRPRRFTITSFPLVTVRLNSWHTPTTGSVAPGRTLPGDSQEKHYSRKNYPSRRGGDTGQESLRRSAVLR